MVAPTSFFGDYGCHVRILEETRVLQALGYRVTIVTYARGRDLPDVTIRRTPPLPWRAHYEVGSSRHKFAFDAYLGTTVLRTALQERPTLVHGHLHEGALIGYPAARLLRVPLIFDYQGSLTGEMLDHGFIQPGSRAERLARWGEARINGLADRVVTSSARAARQYTQAAGGRPALAV
ncbi:MAG: glycosyltransferase, partial [Anaerolineae bacterium]|nr:glycosyltransferase [Anaerolineae bacterium]